MDFLKSDFIIPGLMLALRYDDDLAFFLLLCYVSKSNTLCFLSSSVSSEFLWSEHSCVEKLESESP